MTRAQEPKFPLPCTLAACVSLLLVGVVVFRQGQDSHSHGDATVLHSLESPASHQPLQDTQIRQTGDKAPAASEPATVTAAQDIQKRPEDMARPMLKGANLPMLYGTAWKKERTADLVMQAVLSGFRGIDTACQPKHYREDCVGQAVKRLREEHSIRREDLWLQTKFTPLNSQDPNDVPYDPHAPLPTQVEQSIKKSLENLGTDHIDSLLLHSPLPTREQSMEVWRAFEKALDLGVVGQLGISNLYDLPHFEWIYSNAHHKPKVLQNRFYRDSGYDKGLRKFCLENGIKYQTFWTLTANPHLLQSPAVHQSIQRLQTETASEVTPAQVLFKFLIQSGHQPLTGTTDPVHMQQDLAAANLPDLTAEEMHGITSLME